MIGIDCVIASICIIETFDLVCIINSVRAAYRRAKLNEKKERKQTDCLFNLLVTFLFLISRANGMHANAWYRFRGSRCILFESPSPFVTRQTKRNNGSKSEIEHRPSCYQLIYIFVPLRIIIIYLLMNNRSSSDAILQRQRFNEIIVPFIINENGSKAISVSFADLFCLQFTFFLYICSRILFRFPIRFISIPI